MTFFRDNLLALSPEAIDELVAPVLEEILKRASPQKVILFGSATAGRFDERSDLDFAVVVDDGTSISEVTTRLYRIRLLSMVGLDFVVVPESRFNEMKDIGGVLYVAHHEGKLLYAK